MSMQRKYNKSHFFYARVVVATHIISFSIIRKELVGQESNEPLTFPLKKLVTCSKTNWL